MMRFDFLHDGAPQAIDAIRTAKLPRRFQGVAAAYAALLAAALAAWGLESWRLHGALEQLGRAQARFEASRVAAAASAEQIARLEVLVAEDRELRRIRTSGAGIAERLATLGNLFPRHVSVSYMRAAAGGYALQGRAADLVSFDRLLENLVADHRAGQPQTIDLKRDARDRTRLTFDVAAGEGS
ncbi:MAG TPA: hypothetical protein VMF61_08920 [Candidatus Acidoferrales bacterium]|nr:hypothetical protein [Candidatus Acidoferrales bacterium]